MRVGRLKRLRRALRFFRVAHGFREPFKVLLDGNFVHACMSLSLASSESELAALLSKFLGAEVRLFTTKDVGRELDTLGPEYASSAKLARRINLLRNSSEHEETAAQRQRKRKRYVSARRSIEHAVGSSNAEKVFVATQDSSLREKLKKRGVVPLLFLTQTGVHLEQPSKHQLQLADEKKKALSEVPKHELATNLETQNGLGIGRTKARFRHNRAKGPNPLSCKPPSSKRRKGNDGPSLSAADGNKLAPNTDEGGKRKRRPRRKGKARREQEQEQEQR